MGLKLLAYPFRVCASLGLLLGEKISNLRPGMTQTKDDENKTLVPHFR
jgi:hypothetical protein